MMIITTRAPTAIGFGNHVKGSGPKRRGTTDNSKGFQFFESLFSNGQLSRGKAAGTGRYRRARGVDGMGSFVFWRWPRGGRGGCD